VVREGFDARLARLQEMRAAGSLRHTIEDYRARLQYEIDVIKRMQYPRVLPDHLGLHPVRARAGHPVGPGRGSAAGSLVAYCMRITDVDPLQFDLLFERFLNPERISLRTSTSTSASAGAARSSTTSRASTGARTSRRSSPSGR